MPDDRNYPPHETLADIRAASANTCCVCHERPPTQVHHIDGDRTNAEPENMAWLCKLCHDATHTKVPFNRNLTPADVRAARQRWEAMVAGGLTTSGPPAAVRIEGGSGNAVLDLDTSGYETAIEAINTQDLLAKGIRAERARPADMAARAHCQEGRAVSEYSDSEVKLTDIAEFDPKTGYFHLVGVTFTNCTLVGPAVFALRSGNDVAELSYEAPNLESVWQRLPPSGLVPVGAVIVDNVSVRGGKTRGVSFTGSHDLVDSVFRDAR